MHDIREHRTGLPGQNQSTPVQRRGRYEAVLRLLEGWQADTSGYEERVWPDLVKQIEAERLSMRERFRG